MQQRKSKVNIDKFLKLLDLTIQVWKAYCRGVVPHAMFTRLTTRLKLYQLNDSTFVL